MENEKVSKATTQYVEWLLNRRWFVLIVCLVLAVGLGAGIHRLGFENNYKYTFRADNPQLKAFEHLEATYGKRDNILFLVEPQDGRIFTPQVLEAVRWLSTQAWNMPFAVRVESLAEYQHAEAQGDNVLVASMIPRQGAITPENAQHIQKIALKESAVNGSLISGDGRAAAVNVILSLAGSQPGEEAPAIAYARNLREQLAAKLPGATISIGGFVMLNHSFLEASIRDMQSLVPLMYAVLLVMLALMMKSIGAVVISLSVVLLSVIGALGFAGWIGIPLSAPTSNAPTMIMCICVADSVHLLVAVLRRRRVGEFPREAVRQALSENLRPIILTSLTTAIGFLGLNFSDAQPFNDLGNVAAFGVVIACIYSVTLAPALALMLRTKPLKTSQLHPQRLSWISRLIDKIIIVSASKSRWVLGLTAGIVLVSCIGAAQNRLDDEFVDYFDKSFEFRRSMDRIAETIGGVYTMEFSIPAGSIGGCASPEYLKTIDAFGQWYRQQPGVTHVWSMADVMRNLNMVMHEGAPAYYTIPETVDLASQYLLLYEMSLPYGMDLTDRISIDKSTTRLTISTKKLTAVELRALSAAGTAWLSQNAPAEMQTVASSPGLMFAHLSGRNIKSMIIGSSAGFMLIALTLSIAMRSISLGILSLLPNVVPILAAFGFWGIYIGIINLGLTMVASVALGIVVDDTIHIIERYRRGRRNGLAPVDSVREAWHQSGIAILWTSIALSAGFGILAFSPFGLNSGMGILTSLAIVLALVFDMIMLTALLVFFDPLGKAKTAKDQKMLTEVGLNAMN